VEAEGQGLGDAVHDPAHHLGVQAERLIGKPTSTAKTTLVTRGPV
jgi:hypothetical protein